MWENTILCSCQDTLHTVPYTDYLLSSASHWSILNLSGSCFSLEKRANWLAKLSSLVNRNMVWSYLLPVHFKYNEETHTFICHKAFFLSLQGSNQSCLWSHAWCQRSLQETKGIFLSLQCSAVDCIVLVQHRGDKAQQAGDFKAVLRIADH